MSSEFNPLQIPLGYREVNGGVVWEAGWYWRNDFSFYHTLQEEYKNRCPYHGHLVSQSMGGKDREGKYVCAKYHICGCNITFIEEIG